MSYNIHNFKSGDTLKASQLNEMDEQIKANEEGYAAKQDKLIAGDNIKIAEDGKTISADIDATAIEARIKAIEDKETGWDAKQDNISDIIPTEATETNKLADKNFVNNSIATSGAYKKPTTGIPKTDLASDVQTSLEKADSAIQDLSAYRTSADQDTIDNNKQMKLTAGDGISITDAGVISVSYADGDEVNY